MLCPNFLQDKFQSSVANLIQSNENNYNVHGGITYNDGKKIGFDAAHYDDWNSIITMEGSTYKDVNFMKNEIVKLIDQIEEKKLPVGINV